MKMMLMPISSAIAWELMELRTGTKTMEILMKEMAVWMIRWGMKITGIA